MSPADDYILGNGALHQRFRLATEIVGALASHAPRSLTLAELERHTGHPAKDVVKLCMQLARTDVLRLAPDQVDAWLLAAPASALTLEDVFRCVLDMQGARGKPAARTGQQQRVSHDIDLLMMQATMAINQSVFKHLRQFSLDRLKARASSVASLGALRLSRSRYDESPDLALIA